MHCKKCLHYEVCVKIGKPSLYGINQEIGCSAYKDKTKWTEPITNADKIRSMSDFELAKEIKNAQSGIEIKNPKNIDYFDCILEWLQQPAEGE